MPYLHLVPILIKGLGISKPMDNLKINLDSIMVSSSKVHHQEPMLIQILSKIMVNTIGNIMVSIVTSIMIIGRPMLIQHLANISNNITVNLDLNNILELRQIQRLDNLMGNQDNNKIQASTSMKIKQGVSLEFQLLHLHQ